MLFDSIAKLVVIHGGGVYPADPNADSMPQRKLGAVRRRFLVPHWSRSPTVTLSAG